MDFYCRYLTCYQKKIPDWNVLSRLGKGTQNNCQMITIFTISEYLNIDGKKKNMESKSACICFKTASFESCDRKILLWTYLLLMVSIVSTRKLFRQKQKTANLLILKSFLLNPPLMWKGNRRVIYKLLFKRKEKWCPK